MRLPPLGRSRKPGKVATGAPARGFGSVLAPRPGRFDFLVASGAAGAAFFPADAESGEPGMANLSFGAGAGLGVCAATMGTHARAANQLPAQSMRRRDANIRPSRPRSRVSRQILPFASDRASDHPPELV